VLHYENGTWVDRTTGIDTSKQIVYASVTSLSPFAVVEPVGIAGRMNGAGFVDAGEVRHHFTLQLEEHLLGVERGAFRTWTTSGSGRAQARERFELSTLAALTFVDGDAVFHGSGTWNGEAGFTLEARVTDAGEPAVGRDSIVLVIRNSSGTVVFAIDGRLSGGNIQWRNSQ
jgi:hypothetical protein